MLNSQVVLQGGKKKKKRRHPILIRNMPFFLLQISSLNIRSTNKLLFTSLKLPGSHTLGYGCDTHTLKRTNWVQRGCNCPRMKNLLQHPSSVPFTQCDFFPVMPAINTGITEKTTKLFWSLYFAIKRGLFLFSFGHLCEFHTARIFMREYPCQLCPFELLFRAQFKLREQQKCFQSP